MQIDKGIFNKKLGQYIKDARSAKGYTQENLAKALNKSRPSIVNIEAGRQSPSVLLLVELSNLLSVDLLSQVTRSWVNVERDIKMKIEMDSQEYGISLNSADLLTLSKAIEEVSTHKD